MRAQSGRSSSIVVALLSCAACGDNLVPADPDADNSAVYQPERVGLVALMSGNGSVEASFNDRPDPLAPVKIAEQGECKLYERPSPGTCSADCGDGVCSPEGQCAPLPRAASAGIITVTGLRQGLRLRPGPAGYQPESLPPPDLFDAGASIRVSAPGDTAPAFAAELSGVPALEVAFELVATVPGRPTRLIWTAAGLGRVALEISFAPVGARFTRMLLCEADDNGALTIPAEIAARLGAPLEGELARATMTRLERVVLAGALGPVEVLAGSRIELPYERR